MPWPPSRLRCTTSNPWCTRLWPRSLSGDEARRLVDALAQGERAVGSGIALLTPRVVETGAHAKEGHGNAPDWLASVSGTSAGVARGRLAAAKAAVADEALTRALRDGELSSAQLKVMGRAEACAPGSAETLLELAAHGVSHQELSDAAARLRTASRSREEAQARRTRVHAHRHFRWRQCPDGGIRGEFFADEVQFARVAPLIDARAKARWKAAGAKDPTTLEAHRLDAFIELLAQGASSPGDGGGGSRVETLVVIDAAALRRGSVEGDELCEIEGIGPVSVAAATELLSEGALRYIIKEGFDIKTVTKATRDIATCIDAALIVRDRTCCVHPCGKRLGLQRDHVHVAFRDDGASELDNLVRLCPEHHALKTYGGWMIRGGPGHWNWVAPARPKSAGAISRARKVATARNNPMRT